MFEKPRFVFFPSRFRRVPTAGGRGPSRGVTLLLDFSARLTLNTSSIFFPNLSLHSGGYNMERPSNSAHLAPTGMHLFCREVEPTFVKSNHSLNHNSRSRGKGGISTLSLSCDLPREPREEILPTRLSQLPATKENGKSFVSSLSTPKVNHARGVHRSTDKRLGGGNRVAAHCLEAGRRSNFGPGGAFHLLRVEALHG